jgi:hypothetical protein
MRRFYLYAVVGLFASLLWAGASQTEVNAATQSAQTRESVVAPVQSFADVIEWESLECEPDEPALELHASITNPIDVNGSSIVTEYIVCPILTSMYAGIGVIVNSIEATGLLEIPPLLSGGSVTTDSQKGLSAAWGVMRDLANIGLVIGLFVVVFSQATSYGLSAYGVKKMLPKIVIAALLVNLSYITCATLENLIKSALDARLSGVSDIGDIISNHSGAVTAGLMIFGGAGILIAAFMFLLLLFLVLLFGLVSLVFLVARQILVICLIIAAPLAFIAWLFPNTERNFRNWWSTLIKLLAIYPIVMCLKVVSYVIIIAMSALIGS